MNEVLAQLDRNTIVGFILVLARVSPLFLLAPPFNSSMVPARARLIIACGISIGIAPLALHGLAIPGDAMKIAGLALKEILIGLGFAFSIACLFAAVDAAGSMIDTQIGINFGSLINPVDNTQSGSISQLYSMVGILVFIAIDGEAWVIRGLSPHLRTGADAVDAVDHQADRRRRPAPSSGIFSRRARGRRRRCCWR